MKIKFLKLVILLSTLSMQIFAQQNFAKADAFALKVGRLDSMNMGTIATILTKPFAEKIDKARVIYTWIANNITFDVKAARNTQTDKNTPTEVLLYRKAVGIGFATLFQDMCSSAGIRCLTADGYLKRTTEDIGQNSTEINHSWAVVQLGISPDTWHYVDVALAAGTTDDDLKIFTKQFNDNYFFANKAIFNLQHFPYNEAWKLDAAPKNKKDFYALPLVKSSAYEFGLQKFLPADGKIKTKVNKAFTFSFTLANPAAISKVSIVYGQGKKQKTRDVNFSLSGNSLSFSFKFEMEDTYPVAIKINGKEFMTYLIEVEE